MKRYVTNLDIEKMPGKAVINAYHDLWQVEASFRMAKAISRPVFHRQKEAIEAHLTIVIAALAIDPDLQDSTGVTIKKLVRTLRPLRPVTTRIGKQGITAASSVGTDAREIVDQLPPINAPGH